MNPRHPSDFIAEAHRRAYSSGLVTGLIAGLILAGVSGLLLFALWG